jgi:hypothetical protein
MFDFLSKILSAFLNIWNSLSDETKEKIFSEIDEVYDAVFREFYKNNKQKEA